ncbi:RcnB family protein [Sphingobium sp. AN641]|uniref:RcnB family protein n=1 Tax=Sphingobium sp. AN641 TaxID=3133443 RepID=UPI0030C37AAC
MKIRSILFLTAVAIASTGPMSQARAQSAAVALPAMGKAFAGGHRPMGMKPMVRPGMTHHRWGPRQNGRWHAGWRAPGGWNGYRRPVRGFVLPRYWIQPSFFIANYGSYGLPAPAYGYGWSRYYDDAVMTDRYGRVYDYRNDIHWDRYEGGYSDDYHDGDRGYRRDDGLGGAAIGAVVGGVAGNRIAGRGNRTAGTLVGAAAGAVAGAVIDRAEGDRRHSARPRGPGASYDHGYGYDDDSVTSSNEYDYEGRWTGTWRDENGRTVNGEYEGRFEGTVSGGPGVDYDAPPYADASVPGHHGGYVANGWYYPAPTVTTVTVHPAVTTTTVTQEVVYSRPSAKRKIRRTCKCK